jgi:UDP-glucose 4-epimerase
LNILVTGSLGYVGTQTTYNLELNGYSVFGIDSGFFKACNLVPISKEVPTVLKDIRDSPFNMLIIILKLLSSE